MSDPYSLLRATFASFPDFGERKREDDMPKLGEFRTVLTAVNSVPDRMVRQSRAELGWPPSAQGPSNPAEVPEQGVAYASSIKTHFNLGADWKSSQEEETARREQPDGRGSLPVLSDESALGFGERPSVESYDETEIRETLVFFNTLIGRQIRVWITGKRLIVGNLSMVDQEANLVLSSAFEAFMLVNDKVKRSSNRLARLDCVVILKKDIRRIEVSYAAN